MTEPQQQLLSSIQTISEALALQAKLQLKQHQELKRIADAQYGVVKELALISHLLDKHGPSVHRGFDSEPADATEHRDAESEKGD